MRINTNKDSGRPALKTTWYVICAFSSIQCLVAIICAAFNSQTTNGYKSASFAALWDMFLLMGFVRAAYSIVFQNKSSELVVGCMMGMAYMLAQLFFVLMVVFFIFGMEAEVNNKSTSCAAATFVLFQNPHDSPPLTLPQNPNPSPPAISHLSTAAASSDKAFGAFCFFNMMAYFAWAMLLTVHRDLVINSEEADKNVIGDGDAYIDGAGENFDEVHNTEVDYNPGGPDL